MSVPASEHDHPEGQVFLILVALSTECHSSSFLLEKCIVWSAGHIERVALSELYRSGHRYFRIINFIVYLGREP